MLRDMLGKRGIRMKEVTKQAEETQISHKTLRLMIGTLCHRNATSTLCGRMAYVM